MWSRALVYGSRLWNAQTGLELERVVRWRAPGIYKYIDTHKHTCICSNMVSTWCLKPHYGFAINSKPPCKSIVKSYEARAPRNASMYLWREMEKLTESGFFYDYSYKYKNGKYLFFERKVNRILKNQLFLMGFHRHLFFLCDFFSAFQYGIIYCFVFRIHQKAILACGSRKLFHQLILFVPPNIWHRSIRSIHWL